MDRVIQLVTGAKATIRDFAQKAVGRVVRPDCELIEMAKEGQTEAFCELVRRHQRLVIRQAHYYLKDLEMAKDAAQDVFIRAYEGLPYLKNNISFRGWLYRICKNRCLNIAYRQEIESDNRPVPSESGSENIMIGQFLIARLNQLDDENREILILRYYQGLKYEEIAEMIDISMDNVKIRLFRAKQKLRELVGDDLNEMRRIFK